MTFLVETDEKVARRIEALLWRLQSVLRVDRFSGSVKSDEWRVASEEVKANSSAAQRNLQQFHEGSD